MEHTPALKEKKSPKTSDLMKYEFPHKYQISHRKQGATSDVQRLPSLGQ